MTFFFIFRLRQKFFCVNISGTSVSSAIEVEVAVLPSRRALVICAY